MDPQSPPKRMTRARAAAKASEPAAKTGMMATASSKARAARTTTTATKRKIRPEDVDDDRDELIEPEQLAPTTMKATRTTRGRPKKTEVPTPPEPVQKQDGPALVRSTRGRPKKVAQEPVKEDPVKATRATRAKKTQSDVDVGDTEDEQPKKTTRGRPAVAGPKATVKKTVKFVEPEKENIAPAVTAKSKAAANASESATGLRARPVRKPATTVRTTRAASKATSMAEEEKPRPLSPKKITQIPVSRDIGSDDELATTEKTPLKSLMKSPVKPAASTGYFPSIILGTPAQRPPASPFKDSLKSPAKRMGGVPSASLNAVAPTSNQTAQPSLRASLLQSPAKRPQSPIKGFQNTDRQDLTVSSFKTSLFNTPAKRPFSPIKSLIAPERADAANTNPSPSTKPTILATPLPPVAEQAAESTENLDEDEQMLESPTRLRFPGRLSAVLPRHADPALKEQGLIAMPEMAEEDEVVTLQLMPEVNGQEGITHCMDDLMMVDQHAGNGEPVSRASTTPPHSPPTRTPGMFGLREKDLNPYNDLDSDSDDDRVPVNGNNMGVMSSVFDAVPSTPCPVGSSKTQKTQNVQRSIKSSSRSTAKKPRLDDKFGFTPVAQQLGDWTTRSPLKSEYEPSAPPNLENVTVAGTFFDDEMLIRDGATTLKENEELFGMASGNGVDESIFNDVPITEEDVALAAEAHEMSLMEPSQVEEMVHSQGQEDALSEASQEYGDENAIPIDPALLNAEPGVPPVTPQRTMVRTFHTVSKVPLKPADESTPRPKMRKRSASISRLPVQRPTRGLTRNATVISYSPMKHRAESVPEDRSSGERAGSEPPVTPAKSETGWSTIGTPAHTPRRDVNPALLRGAVVFVDVHTTEGADASGIFVELLTQMGARCVKNWVWNPSSPPDRDQPSSSSKIGITHVVYKDGGKRTMEKVRESGGVVQCVGVSWVLDCERENEWLDEAPYYIDTSLVPRGGHRRRKSMEPRALANLNGTLVPTPSRAGTSARDAQSLPSTPANNRRQSGLWMRTPEDGDGYDHADGEQESAWEVAPLSPVPKTPAPEAIARFAADVTPETPSADSDAETVRAELMTRTCPTKTAYHELGEGVLAREKDERVLARLMAARRKSLQFAPKVGSPLARAW